MTTRPRPSGEGMEEFLRAAQKRDDMEGVLEILKIWITSFLDDSSVLIGVFQCPCLMNVLHNIKNTFISEGRSVLVKALS